VRLGKGKKPDAAQRRRVAKADCISTASAYGRDPSLVRFGRNTQMAAGSDDVAWAGDASAIRDHIDQPKARKAHQADKNQGNGIYDHAMPIIIIAFRAFVFREVANR
jgi:hypothetical protein